MVREPAPKNIPNVLHPWKLAVARPSRFTKSVFLDIDTEPVLLNDMEDYKMVCHSRDSIPERLPVSWPLGTGKTSAALAPGGGGFGLEIYSALFGNNWLTEDGFDCHFNTLPHHCILLLTVQGLCTISKQVMLTELLTKSAKTTIIRASLFQDCSTSLMV